MAVASAFRGRIANIVPVVILCDPPLQRLSPDPNEIVDGNNKSRPIENVENQLKSDPYQEGYVDFLPPVPYDRMSTMKPHPHASLLDDIIHYYEQH